MQVTSSLSTKRNGMLATRTIAGLLAIGTLLGACGGAAQTAAPNPAALDTSAPSVAPTAAPTSTQTLAPTLAPTAAPTVASTIAPTAAPTVAATAKPAVVTAPTVAASPAVTPAVTPTLAPSAVATTARPTFLMPDEPAAIGYLAKATSYGLVPLPATNASRLATNFNSIAGVGTRLTGFSVRSVTKAGNTVAIALVLSLCPCAASQQDAVLESIVSGEVNSGYSAQRETLAGRSAAYFQDFDGVSALMWAQGGEIVVLYGTNRTQLELLATALITANQ
jgi:hypothetical protein